MTLYFITGKKNKFNEAGSIVKNLEQVDINLPEIQEIDAKKIIKTKLLEALNHKKSDVIVEDTSLYLDCLNGLPGPLIKWFLKTIGNIGIYNLAESLKNTKAEAKTVIGYAKNPDKIYFFEGLIKGRIVSPIGESNFGWDPIFQPLGYSKSFAQMSKDEKNSISMRRLAFNKLERFLQRN